MIRVLWALISMLAAVVAARAGAGQRFNHEGRLLGPVPAAVTTPILFNTAEADAIVSALQLFPPDNPWNERVAGRPLHANSAAIIGQVNTDFLPASRKLVARIECSYVLVPENQPRQQLTIFEFEKESDYDGGTLPVALYPIPTNLPISPWPVGTGSQTLLNWQTVDNGSDRRAIMLAPGSGALWETWFTLRVGTAWRASNAVKFSLHSNAPRPDGYTSPAASGCPLLAGLARYDECARGWSNTRWP